MNSTPSLRAPSWYVPHGFVLCDGFSGVEVPLIGAAQKKRNSWLISPWMWLVACRSGQLTGAVMSSQLELSPHMEQLLSSWLLSPGKPMSCEGEDDLWQDTAEFLCSLCWELSCPGSPTEEWLAKPHALAAAMNQVGEGGQEGEIWGLNNSPRVVFLLPCFSLVSCRQMRRGRRRRRSPRATRSQLCCRHLWSPHHRYSPSLLPCQPP